MRIYLCLLIAIISFNVWSNDFYYSNFFKFKIIKPDNWIQADENAGIKNLNEIDFSDDQKKEILQGHQGKIFLVSFLKYDPNEQYGIIPTINVSVLENRFTTMEDLIELAKNTENDFKGCFEKYEIIEKPSIVNINNIESVTATGRFILEENHQKFIIKSKMYLIPRDDYIFQINMSNEYNNPDGEEEFKKIEDEIYIDN